MKKDPVSVVLAIIGISLSVYFMTYEALFQSAVISGFLGVAGIAFMEWSIKDTDPVKKNYWSAITLVHLGYGVLGFVLLTSMGLIGVNLSLVNLSLIESLSMSDKILYGVVISINEESFFRGGFQGWLMTKTGGFETASTIISAAFFTVYHLAVTQAEWGSLTFIFLSGIILGKIYSSTRMLWPSTLTHLLHNVRLVL